MQTDANKINVVIRIDSDAYTIFEFILNRVPENKLFVYSVGSCISDSTIYKTNFNHPYLVLQKNLTSKAALSLLKIIL